MLRPSSACSIPTMAFEPPPRPAAVLGDWAAAPSTTHTRTVTVRRRNFGIKPRTRLTDHTPVRNPSFMRKPAFALSLAFRFGLRARRFGRQVGTAGLALSLAAACTTRAENSPYFGKTVPPEGQHMRYISGSEPESLDPQVSSGQPEARLHIGLFDGLTEYHPETAQPIPALAESWEPNSDNSEFTFHLRNAKWSNGDPVTAQDFVYSLRRGLAPEFAARTAYLAYYIKGAQAY